MKKLFIIGSITAIVCLSVRGQIALNPGDTYVYEFTSLPELISPAVGFGSEPVGVFELTLSGFEFGTDILRFEAFEDTLRDPPLFVVVAESSSDGTTFRGWADFQGVIRLTMLSGSVTLESMTFAHQVPLDPLFGERHQFMVIPVRPSDLVAQLAPCAGPVNGGAWKNHGEYVSAVTKAAKTLVAQGRISGQESAEIIAGAARSACGKK